MAARAVTVGFILVLCGLLASIPYAHAGDVAGCGQICSAGLPCNNNHCSYCLNPVTNAPINGTETGYCVRGGAVNTPCMTNSQCYFATEDGNQVECVFDKGVGTCTKTSSTANYAIGFVCVGVAILCFGSNFLPVKKFDTGDGVFFQFCMGVAIWIVGLIVQLARGSPTFHPYAMIGGVLWCTGNIMVVPTVQAIGLALGMCIWGSTNMVAGWASGNFGLLGVTKESVNKPALNYAGVGVAVIATLCFSMVKPSLDENKELDDHDYEDDMHASVNTALLPKEKESFLQRLSPGTRRIVGIGLAVLQGLFYGINFDPPTHLMDNFIKYEQTKGQQYSNNGLDYVFGHFCGILLASTTYTIIYGIARGNKPFVNYKAILPGMLSGAIWASAQTAWFVANANLSMVIAFPMVSIGPPIVATLWGVLLFKEITGKRNFTLLGIAFASTGAAAALITMSKFS